MTVSELANKLNTTVPEIFEHYKKILVDIPQDENFVLSTELIRRAIPNYKAELEHSENLAETIYNNSSGSISHFNINHEIESRRTKRAAILEDLEPFYKKSEKVLLKEIKRYNSIDNLVLEGVYYKVREGNFGFFENVSIEDGRLLRYPISDDPVDKVFVPTTALQSGKRYLFEVVLARRSEREKQANPFLLQTKNDSIHEIEELTALSQELKIKQSKLKEITSNLLTVEEQYEAKKDELEQKVSKVFNEKQNEANSIIEAYNETIKSKYCEIQDKEKELTILKESVEFSNIQIHKMENILSTLKDRVSLCRNLQFISENDENRFLNLLSAKEYKPVDHLDFEADFDNDFSKLSEHIHAFLFRKKHLIYTRFQIKNILTLLRTHDLIVLSGLSGSGKTQIIKAFAEALGGVVKIIPVKPNWTSSEDLIGYYNPLQMTFLPTPFTEAIVEAINNPQQLYFICLDEMNLARAEYYFADFLSKLEERGKQPEIELYANHEEELFVSEFNTLLNLVESSIKGEQIKSWQDFLDNKEARTRFFEMLGNTDKESMLQLHAKMKRRLIDILKFPSTIKIPDNVRFVGAINVDETTHYFSPKILDRIHVVKFDNPLLFEDQVNSWFENSETEKELKPVYVQPNLFSTRKEFPTVNDPELAPITGKLKDINKQFLLPLNIDFGIRSIRQSLNYAKLNKSSYDYGDVSAISLNTVILQKIFPRFMFDGSETSKTGKSKIEVVEEFQKFLSDEFIDFYSNEELDETDIGKSCSEYLADMVDQAKRNSSSQFNFFA